MAVQVNFKKLRRAKMALTHDWDFHLDVSRFTPIFNAHPHPKWKALCDLLNERQMGNELKIRCKSSTIPKSTAKAERIKIYGIPTSVILEDNADGSITLSFLEDEKHHLYRFFSLWKDLGASHRTPAITDRGSLSTNTYCGVDLKLRLSPGKNILGEDTQKLLFTLYAVHPTSVDLSKVDNNIGFQTIGVTFKYDTFEVE